MSISEGLAGEFNKIEPVPRIKDFDIDLTRYPLVCSKRRRSVLDTHLGNEKRKPFSVVVRPANRNLRGKLPGADFTS
ncbi:MAG TPA: hypothetical protein VND64_22360 [Pirellulales bacterium]|nr:hypothetical protein [Pirellulales bacterium]